MSNSKISKPQADLQIIIWEKEAEQISSADLYLRMQKLELPEEVASRLHDLLSQTQKIGKKIIHVGKIILLKIIDFVEKHLFLVAGIGIGVMIGAAVSNLIISLPLIGSLLIPIATVLQITTAGSGAVLGYSLDQSLPNVGKSISEIAKEFFQFLVDVFVAIMDADSVSIAKG